LDIHNLGAENVGNLHHLGARGGINGDFLPTLTLDPRIRPREILYLHHVGELVELFDDLLQGGSSPRVTMVILGSGWIGRGATFRLSML